MVGCFKLRQSSRHLPRVIHILNFVSTSSSLRPYHWAINALSLMISRASLDMLVCLCALGMGSLFLPPSAFSLHVLLLCSLLTDLKDKLVSYPLIVSLPRDPVLVDLFASTPSSVFPNSRLLDFQGPSYLLEYLAFIPDYDGKLLTYKTIFISKS